MQGEHDLRSGCIRSTRSDARDLEAVVQDSTLITGRRRTRLRIIVSDGAGLGLSCGKRNARAVAGEQWRLTVPGRDCRFGYGVSASVQCDTVLTMQAIGELAIIEEGARHAVEGKAKAGRRRSPAAVIDDDLFDDQCGLVVVVRDGARGGCTIVDGDTAASVVADRVVR